MLKIERNLSPLKYDLMKPSVAIVLINTGSPNAPTAPAVKTYLEEFLSDTRVVELPRWKWWPILHGIILTTRPAKSAERYQIVWTPEGSPLILHSQAIVDRVAERLADLPVKVYSAMCYGSPSMASVMKEIADAGIKKVLCLPMFAQYSSHTSASCVEGIFKACMTMRDVPALRTVYDFCHEPLYIEGLKRHIEAYWAEKGSAVAQGGKLLFSFHGIPQSSIEKGDRYQEDCVETAERVAAALQLPREAWEMSFQSRFGRDPWIQPYTTDKVVELAQAGVKRIDVICPGFAADCLETIEEINDDLRRTYLAALPEEDRVDEAFHYIPAMNASPEAIDLYEAILRRELQGWV